MIDFMFKILSETIVGFIMGVIILETYDFIFIIYINKNIKNNLKKQKI